MSLGEFRKDYFRYMGHINIKLSDLLIDHSLRYLLALRGGSP